MNGCQKTEENGNTETELYALTMSELGLEGGAWEDSAGWREAIHFESGYRKILKTL